jgi:hypothetical protein
VAPALVLWGCTGSTSDNNSSEGTVAESVVDASDGGSSRVALSKLTVPEDAVAIDYFVAKGEAPLLKETLLPLKAPTKTVSMIVNNITYAGVVCGFSFTGAERPKPPIAFRMQVEQADGSVIDATVDVSWDGDVEKAGSAALNGWNFLSDAQINRNGPGWVVQLGAIPEGGGQDVPSPTRALCTATSAEDMPVSVGPVAYWAGFATR